MEESEIQAINGNMFKILPLTSCSVHFLSFFKQHNILSDVDIDQLRAEEKREGKLAMAHKLYEILLSRQGSFSLLLDALRETKQTGAFELISNAHQQLNQEKNRPEYNRFMQPPQYLQAFLKSTDSGVFVVISKNVELTCERILTTVPYCILYTSTNYLKSISQPNSSAKLSDVVRVVNCINKDIRMMVYHAHACPGKLIFVGEKYEPENLTRTFQPHDIIRWNELSPIFQFEICEKVCSMTQMKSEKCLQLLENMDSDLLYQLIENEPIKFFRDTIPSELSYYIPRRLVSRRKISTKIFQTKELDVFLIEGIESFELSNLAEGHSTNTSTNILTAAQTFSEQFVVLADAAHLPKLMKLANNKNVHHLTWENGQLFWNRSQGKINALQNYIEENQNILNEDEFIEEATKNVNRNAAIISDTPGMGKSVLLAHIAKKLSISENSGVCFAVISEIVHEIRQLSRGSDQINDDLIIRSVGKQICENEIGIEAFVHQAQRVNHLLLDAFDEINVMDLYLGYRVLDVLHNRFSDTTIWITARPHMLKDLEQRLQILGFNIQAFENSDQEQFLASYWSNSEDGLDQAKLHEFGAMCLRHLKSKLRQNEEDFAGIPLQCLLIAEVYSDEAKIHNQSRISEPIFQISSISDLYEELVKQKYEKFIARYHKDRIDKTHFDKCHMYYSILLLFPWFTQTFETRFYNKKLAQQDIFSAGVLEPKPTKYSREPRFIHRTFAEYFVAKFVVQEFFEVTQQPCSNMWNLLYKNILDTSSVLFRLHGLKVTVREFKYNVICYFVNTFLKCWQDSISTVHLQLSRKQLEQMCVSCAYENFEHIFRVFLFDVAFKSGHAKKIFSEKLVLVSAARAEKRLYLKVFDSYKCLTNLPLDEIKTKEFTLLHTAVSIGNYLLVEHLVKKESFKVCSSKEDFQSLVRLCICDTLKHRYQDIKDRINILQLLLKNYDENWEADLKNQLLLDKKGNIHVDIALRLLEWDGTRHNIKDAETFISNYTKVYDSFEFMHLTKTICEKMDYKIPELCRGTNNDGKLFLNICKNVMLSVEFLEFLKENGVNFNEFCKLVRLAPYYVFKSNDIQIGTWFVQHAVDLDLPAIVNHCLNYENYNLICLILETYDNNEMETNLINYWLSRGIEKFYNSLDPYSSNFQKVFKFASKLVIYLTRKRVNGSIVSKEKDISLLSILAKTIPFELKTWTTHVDSLTTQNLQLRNYKVVLDNLKQNQPAEITYKALHYLLTKVSSLSNEGLKEVIILIVQNSLTDVWKKVLSWYCSSQKTSINKLEVTLLNNQPTSLLDVALCSDDANLLDYIFGSGHGHKLLQPMPKSILDDYINTSTIQTECRKRKDPAFAEWQNQSMDIIPFSTDPILSFSNIYLNPLEYTNINTSKLLLYLVVRGKVQLIKPLLECGPYACQQDAFSFMVMVGLVEKRGASLDCWESLTKLATSSSFVFSNTVNNQALVCLNSVLCIVEHTNLPQEKIAAGVLIIVATCCLDTVTYFCSWYTKYCQKLICNVQCPLEDKQFTALDAALLSCNGDVLDYVLNELKCTEKFEPFDKSWLNECVSEECITANREKFLSLVSEMYSPSIFNTLDVHGNTLLMHSDFDTRLVRHICQLGADVNALGENQTTPLHEAVKLRRLTMIEALIECGANVNAKNALGLTPLLIVAKQHQSWSSSKTINLLIESNANLTETDCVGDTFLHLYIKSCSGNLYDYEVLAQIIQKGYRHLFDIQGKGNVTPLQLLASPKCTLENKYVLLLNMLSE